MKKAILTTVCSLVCAVAAQATITIELDAGILRNATGTATEPVGGLLQIIASKDGTVNFAAPTPTSFVGGSSNNIVVATISMNNVFGTGETDSVFTLTLQNTIAPSSSTLFDQGDPLILRWYPSLTTAATAPGIGTTYGQYRSNTGVTNGASTSIAWVTPADGGSYAYPTGLVFNTVAAGGTNAEITGYATNVVLVPEPSMYALSIIGFGALLLFARRRNNVKIV